MKYYTKTILSKFLPHSTIEFLRLVRKINRFLERPRQDGSPVIKNWKLPSALIIAIKEYIQIEGTLDWMKTQIKTEIDSFQQVKRLHAAQKEPETITWIEKNIKPGDVFYDVGANIGAYSFIAYFAVAGKITVYSIEPVFSTFKALCSNIFLNNCAGKIIPLNLMLSSKTGLENFYYSSLTPGSASHSSGKMQILKTTDEKLKQPIVAWRMDDLISQFNISKPTHLKIDVDGAELGVLKGAENTLKEDCVRSILIEIDESSPDFKEIINIIETSKFKIEEKYRHSNSKIFNYIFKKI